MVRVTGLEPVRLLSTRPSNVPVYQFQHTRIFTCLSAAFLLYRSVGQKSSPVSNFFGTVNSACSETIGAPLISEQADCYIGEIFLYKRDFFDREGASVQVSQRTVRRKPLKRQLIGIQRLEPFLIRAVLFGSAVFAVAQKRVPQRRHMRADLVRPPGDQLAVEQAQPVAHGKRPVQRDRRFRAGDLRAVHRDLLAFFVPAEEERNLPLRGLKLSVDNAEVALARGWPR